MIFTFMIARLMWERREREGTYLRTAKMAWHEDKCDRQQIDLQRYLVHAGIGLLMCEVRCSEVQ